MIGRFRLTLFWGLGLVVIAAGPGRANPAIDELIAQAQGEIATLRDEIADSERNLARREEELARAKRDANSHQDVERRIEAKWRRVSFDPIVGKMTGACRDNFLNDASAADFTSALQCVRDEQVSAVVQDDLGCGKLTWTEGRGEHLTLTGYVGDESEKAALSAKYGAATVDAVRVQPWPICEALDTLEIPITSEDRPSIRMLENRKSFRFGDSLAFEVETPAFPAFLYLAYLQADGAVYNLTPRAAPFRRQSAPLEVMRFGDGLRGRQKFTATSPAGAEAIVAIASRSPIRGLENLETSNDGQYWVGAPGGALIDRGTYLKLLNDSLKDIPKGGVGNRELSADVRHVNIQAD